MQCHMRCPPLGTLGGAHRCRAECSPLVDRVNRAGCKKPGQLRLGGSLVGGGVRGEGGGEQGLEPVGHVEDGLEGGAGLGEQR